MHNTCIDMSYLRRLIAGFAFYRPSFNLRLIDVGFVVNKLASGQVCRSQPSFSLIISTSFYP